MKIIKAQSMILSCQVFSEDDVTKRFYWYFNQNQSLSPKKFYNESTILIDTPQNQDTVSAEVTRQTIRQTVFLH
jgi:hypothetical protein